MISQGNNFAEGLVENSLLALNFHPYHPVAQQLHLLVRIRQWQRIFLRCLCYLLEGYQVYQIFFLQCDDRVVNVYLIPGFG
jgi:hypothetical protein